MKYHVFSALILLGILSACVSNSSSKPNPSGKAGVMIIVMNDKVKDSEGGKKLWDMMVQPMLGLPQEEQMFDVSVIPHRSMSDFIKTYRNMVLVEVSSDVKKEGISFFKGKWAKGQALVRIQAKSNESLGAMLSDNELKLVGFFVRAERERLMNYFKTTFHKELSNHIKNTRGFRMTIPQDFSLRKDTMGFFWASAETAKTSLGLFVYSFDYVGKGTFSREYLLNKRDSALHKNVPGPSEGSYMTTEHQFPPIYRRVSFEKDTAVILRGLWKVQGDMMGGPFLSMIHLDKKTNTVIVTEGYSYNPEKPEKRNMVRQLEAILYSFKYVEK